MLTARISKGLVRGRAELKCEQRKSVKFCRLQDNRDQQKAVVLLVVTCAVYVIDLSVH